MWHPRLLSAPRRLLAAGLCAVALLSASCATQQPQSPMAEIGAPVRDALPGRRFRQDVKSWRSLKRENVVMQQRDYSCGAAALATLLQYHLGDPVTETMLLQEITKMLTPVEMQDRIKKGLSLTDLRRVAVRLKYQASIGRLEFDKLRESKVPLVVGVIVEGYDHFVVYRGMDDRYVYLADPARGNVRTPIPLFQKQWQKNAILVVVKPGQTPPTASALSVTPDEVSLGTLNVEFLRRRLSQTPRPDQ